MDGSPGDPFGEPWASGVLGLEFPLDDGLSKSLGPEMPGDLLPSPLWRAASAEVDALQLVGTPGASLGLSRPTRGWTAGVKPRCRL